MTTRDEESSREEAIYARAFAFLKHHGFAIALIAPLLLISLVPMGPALQVMWGCLATLLILAG